MSRWLRSRPAVSIGWYPCDRRARSPLPFYSFPRGTRARRRLPSLASTHPHQYIRYDCQGDPLPSQRLKIGTSISRRGCGIMVAGTRQEPRWMRTEAVWKPAIGPSLEVESTFPQLTQRRGRNCFPFPPGDSPPRSSDFVKATRMTPRWSLEQASATRILHVQQFYDPPPACRR